MFRLVWVSALLSAYEDTRYKMKFAQSIRRRKRICMYVRWEGWLPNFEHKYSTHGAEHTFLIMHCVEETTATSCLLFSKSSRHKSSRCSNESQTRNLYTFTRRALKEKSRSHRWNLPTLETGLRVLFHHMQRVNAQAML